jgi:hypothetical protein
VLSRLRNTNTLMLLVAALVVVAAAGYRMVSVKDRSVDEMKEAERFLHGILHTQYARPIPPDASSKLIVAYDVSSDEVQRELSRILTELDNEQTAMADRKASYRDSTVRVRIRSIEDQGNYKYAVVEVLADWYWGYDGKPTDIPTQTYNLHEVRLTRNGNSWKVILDRNLASTPTAQVRVTPLQWSD